MWAAPFDLDRLELTGDAVPAIEDVSTGGSGFAQFTVADNGTLLYRRGGGNSGALALVWVDRQGQVEPLPAEPRPYGGLRISPDGQRVAVGVFEEGNGDVIVYDLARDTPTRLTFDPARDAFPLWTQDGERVVFASARDGGPLNVYSKAADGTGDVERLTTRPHLQVPASWADDGRTLVLYERSPDTGGDVAVLSMDGANETELLLKEEFAQAYPEISPDGRWMAYQSTESGQPEIYVQPFPNVDDGKWQISRDGGRVPMWGPDGRELFFRSSDASMMVAPIDTEPTLKALFMTVWCPDSRSVESNCGIPRG